MAGSISTWPTVSRSISMVIAPGRRSVGISPDTSTIVDSTPIPTAPPSMIISIFPSMSSMTCSAFVGLGLPDVLALGADTYPPPARISSRAISSSGIRTATVSRPPVVPSGTFSFLLKIIVSGPGQKCAAISSTISGTDSTIAPRSSSLAIWTISGLSDGRPFAA